MRIIGGASFPAAAMGTVNASWPLAVLRCDEDGISVDLRWLPVKRSLRKLTKYAGQRRSEDAWWSSSWDTLSSAKISPRSVVLTNDQQESCKFVTLTSVAMERLGRYLEQRNIMVQRVRSNLSYGWREL